MNPPIVTLTTDFGLEDPYVGIIKGVLLGRAPHVRIVDLTHSVPRGDECRAAWTLHGAWSFFPPGTVHVVVVDPGVGSDRRILAARAAGAAFLAPDTGIVPAALDPFGEGGPDREFRTLDAKDLVLDRVSRTFHGRDVFAPAAAALAAGRDFTTVGPACLDPVVFSFPRAAKDGLELRGEVLHVDRFGNLETNIREKDLPRGMWRAEVCGSAVDGPAEAYADVRTGELLGIVGSGGYLEIAVRDGDANAVLGAEVGAPVAVRPVRPG